jgi:3-hydroxyisobutyrate dehydrogenase-like beta-hydroxyacid dehydrogenase
MESKMSSMQSIVDCRVGIVGLGLVGSALAENVVRAGHELHGFDIDEVRKEQLERVGGVWETDPCNVAARSQVVFLSVPDSDAVSHVIEGERGLLSASATPPYVIDTTTGDCDAMIAVGSKLKDHDIAYLDAPLSGSSRQIRERDGVFLIGGRREDYETCLPLFEQLSRRHYYLGPSGSGSKAKLASNLILGLNRLALAEGLILAERLGLDPASFLEVVRNTPAYSVAVDQKGKKMVESDFVAESKVAQHRKDLDIILRFGRKYAQPLPLAEAHHRILKSAESTGLSEADTSAVIEQLRRMGQISTSE